MILEIKNVEKSYGHKTNPVYVLKGVDLVVKNGEFIALMGKSGCGKSTLLHLVAGYLKPDTGQINIKDIDIATLNDSEISKFRRSNISFIFQFFNLFPELSVYENIILPLKIDKREIDHQLVDECVELLGLSDKLKRFPGELSGGEQQRVAIARALAVKPTIIIADEPTGNLDEETSKEVMRLLKMMQKKYQQTILMASHDHEVASYADKIIKMKDGKLLD